MVIQGCVLDIESLGLEFFLANPGWTHAFSKLTFLSLRLSSVNGFTGPLRVCSGCLVQAMVYSELSANATLLLLLVYVPIFKVSTRRIYTPPTTFEGVLSSTNVSSSRFLSFYCKLPCMPCKFHFFSKSCLTLWTIIHLSLLLHLC